jgi:thioredoxin
MCDLSRGESMTGLEIRRKDDRVLPLLDPGQSPPPQPPSVPQANPAQGAQGPLVAEVTAGSLLGSVSGPGLVLVDLWAPWCSPCRFLAPVLEDIAREYAGRLRILKLNVDLDRSVLATYGIMSIPTLILFRDGVIAGRIIGAQPRANIEELIRRFI